MKKAILSAIMFVGLCLGQALVTKAAPPVITLIDTTLTGTAGSVMPLLGTYYNPNAQPFFITATTGSLFSSPIVSSFSFGSGTNPIVGPGETTSPAPLTIFTLAPDAAIGDYQVYITAGGRTGFYSGSVFYQTGPFETSDPAYFTISVTPSVIPEPATVTLLGTGLMGIGLGVYKRRELGVVWIKNSLSGSKLPAAHS